MIFENRRVVSLMLRFLCVLALMAMAGCDDDSDPVPMPEEIEIEYDFVADQMFPADSNNRESEPDFEFEESGITVRVTATDDEGMPVNVSRRGPGGLGVVGNSGALPGPDGEPTEETTSGNRVNNGEMLILEILDASGNPVSAQLIGVTFSRIRQLGPFETGFEIIADNNGAFAVEVEGTLDPDNVDEFVGTPVRDEDGDLQNVVIDIEDMDLFGDMFTFTNGRPFHATGNRYRVGGITILVEEG